MPIWEWLLESAGGVLLLVLMLGIALVVRRRWLTRNGGTFEVSYRARHSDAGGPEARALRPPGPATPSRVGAGSSGWGDTPVTPWSGSGSSRCRRAPSG